MEIQMGLTVILLVFVTFSSVTSFRQVCYYTNWSASRPGLGHFTPADINPNLCTHIIFAYARVVGDRIVPTGLNDENSPTSVGFYERVTSLKAINPNLKVLLGLNGWNTRFYPTNSLGMVAGPGFVRYTIDFLRRRDFDGVDVDWEYSTRRRGHPTSKDGFTELLRALHSGFEAEAARTGKPKLILSVAVTARRDDINKRYHIPSLTRFVDFINVMSYDFHGPWKTTLGHSSPLHARKDQVGEGAYRNTEASIRYWIQRGADRKKLTAGIPFYGRTYTVMRPNQTTIGDNDVGIGPAGPFTLENGFMSYYEICELLRSGATRVFHPEHKAPYLITGNTWVSFDDPQSVREKAKWIKAEGLGGAMIWSLDLDDFSGKFCRNGRYPLLNEINSEFKGIQEIKTGTSEPDMGLIHGSWKSLNSGLETSQPADPSLPRDGGLTIKSVGTGSNILDTGFSSQSGAVERLLSMGTTIEGQGTGPQIGTSQGMSESGMRVVQTGEMMLEPHLSSKAERDGTLVVSGASMESQRTGQQIGMEQGMFGAGMRVDQTGGMSAQDLSAQSGPGRLVKSGSSLEGQVKGPKTGTGNGMFESGMHIERKVGMMPEPGLSIQQRPGERLIISGASMEGQSTGPQTGQGQNIFGAGIRVDQTGGMLQEPDLSSQSLPEGKLSISGASMEGQSTGPTFGIDKGMFDSGLRVEGTGGLMLERELSSRTGPDSILVKSGVSMEGQGIGPQIGTSQGIFESGMQVDRTGETMLEPHLSSKAVRDGTLVAGGASMESQSTGPQIGMEQAMFEAGMRVDQTGGMSAQDLSAQFGPGRLVKSGSSFEGQVTGPITGMDKGTFKSGMHVDRTVGMMPEPGLSIQQGPEERLVISGASIAGQSTGPQTGRGQDIFETGTRVDQTRGMLQEPNPFSQSRPDGRLAISGTSMEGQSTGPQFGKDQGIFDSGLRVEGTGGMMLEPERSSRSEPGSILLESGVSMEGQGIRPQIGTEQGMIELGLQVDKTSGMMPELGLPLQPGHDEMFVLSRSLKDGQVTRPKTGTEKRIFEAGLQVDQTGEMMSEPGLSSQLGPDGRLAISGSSFEGQVTGSKTGKGQGMFESGFQVDGKGGMVSEPGLSLHQGPDERFVMSGASAEGQGTGVQAGTSQGMFESGMPVDRTGRTMLESVLSSQKGTGSQSGMMQEGMFQAGMQIDGIGGMMPDRTVDGVAGTPATVELGSFDRSISLRGTGAGLSEKGKAIGTGTGERTITTGRSFEGGITDKYIAGSQELIKNDPLLGGIVHQSVAETQIDQGSGMLENAGVQSGFADGTQMTAQMGTGGGMVNSAFDISIMDKQMGTSDGVIGRSSVDRPFVGKTATTNVLYETGTAERPILMEQTGKTGGIIEGGTVDGTIVGSRTGGEMLDIGAVGGSMTIKPTGIVGGIVTSPMTGAAAGMLESGAVIKDLSVAKSGTSDGLFESGTSGLSEGRTFGGTIVQKGSIGGIFDGSYVDGTMTGEQIGSAGRAFGSDTVAGANVDFAVRQAGRTFDSGVVDGTTKASQTGITGGVFETVKGDAFITGPKTGTEGGILEIGSLDGRVADTQSGLTRELTDRRINDVTMVAQNGAQVQSGAVHGNFASGQIGTRGNIDRVSMASQKGTSDVRFESGTFDGPSSSGQLGSLNAVDKTGTFDGTVVGALPETSLGMFNSGIDGTFYDSQTGATGELLESGSVGNTQNGRRSGMFDSSTVDGAFTSAQGGIGNGMFDSSIVQAGISDAQPGTLDGMFSGGAVDITHINDQAGMVGGAFGTGTANRKTKGTQTGTTGKIFESGTVEGTVTGSQMGSGARIFEIGDSAGPVAGAKIGIGSQTDMSGTRSQINSFETGTPGEGYLDSSAFERSGTQKSKVDIPAGWAFETGKTTGVKIDHAGIGSDSIGSLGVGSIGGTEGGIKSEFGQVVHGSFVVQPVQDSSVHLIEKGSLKIGESTGIQTGQADATAGFANDALALPNGVISSKGHTSGIKMRSQDVSFIHTMPSTTDTHGGTVRFENIKKVAGQPDIDGSMSMFTNKAIRDSFMGSGEQRRTAGTSEDISFSGHSAGARVPLLQKERSGAEIKISGLQIVKSDKMYPQSGLLGLQTSGFSDGTTFDQAVAKGSGSQRKVISTYTLHDPVMSPLFSWSGQAPPPGLEEIGSYDAGNVMTDLSMDRTETKYIQPISKAKSSFAEWNVVPSDVVSAQVGDSAGSKQLGTIGDIHIGDKSFGIDSAASSRNTGVITGVEFQSDRVGTQMQTTDGGNAVPKLHSSGIKKGGGAFEIGSFMEHNPAGMQGTDPPVRTDLHMPVQDGGIHVESTGSGVTRNDFISGNTGFRSEGPISTDINMFKQQSMDSRKMRVDQPNVMLAASKTDQSIEPQIGQSAGHGQFESGVFSTLQGLDFIPGDASITQLESGITQDGSIHMSGHDTSKSRGAALLANRPLDSGMQVIGSQTQLLQTDSLGTSNARDMSSDAFGAVPKEGFMSTGGVGIKVRGSGLSSSENNMMLHGAIQSRGDAFPADKPLDSGMKVVRGQTQFMQTDSFGSSNAQGLPFDTSGMVSKEGVISTGLGGVEVGGSVSSPSKNDMLMQSSIQSGGNAFLSDKSFDSGMKVVGGQSEFMQTGFGASAARDLNLGTSGIVSKEGFSLAGEDGRGGSVSGLSKNIIIPSQSSSFDTAKTESVSTGGIRLDKTPATHVQGSEIYLLAESQGSQSPSAETRNTKASIERTHTIGIVPSTFENKVTKQVSGQIDIDGMGSQTHNTNFNMANTGLGQTKIMTMQSDKPTIMRTESGPIVSQEGVHGTPQIVHMQTQTEMGTTADHRHVIIDKPFGQSQLPDTKWQGEGNIVFTGKDQVPGEGRAMSAGHDHVPGERITLSGSFDVSGINQAKEQGGHLQVQDNMIQFSGPASKRAVSSQMKLNAGQTNMKPEGFNFVSQRNSGSISGSTDTVAFNAAVNAIGQAQAGQSFSLDNQLTSNTNIGSSEQNQENLKLMKLESHRTGADPMSVLQGQASEILSNMLSSESSKGHETRNANLIGINNAGGTHRSAGSLTQPTETSATNSGWTWTGGHYMLDPIVPFRESLFRRGSQMNKKIIGLNRGGTANSQNTLSMATREFAPSHPAIKREPIIGKPNTNSHINELNTRQWSMPEMRMTNNIGTNFLKEIGGRTELLDSNTQQIGSPSGATLPIPSKAVPKRRNCEPGNLICLTHINKVVVRKSTGKETVGIWEKTANVEKVSKPNV